MHLYVLWGTTILLFLTGLAGTFIPALPGIGLVYAGILLYAFSTGFTSISAGTTIALGVVALLALAADYAGSVIGVGAAGGKRYAIIGALVGTMIGVISGGPVGLFVGAFIGGLIGALTEGHTHSKAAKIAVLSVIGTLGASIVQLILGIVMIAAFLMALLV